MSELETYQRYDYRVVKGKKRFRKPKDKDNTLGGVVGKIISAVSSDYDEVFVGYRLKGYYGDAHGESVVLKTPVLARPEDLDDDRPPKKQVKDEFGGELPEEIKVGGVDDGGA